MEISEEVNAFLKAHDASYRHLLDQITQACIAVKEDLGGAIVRAVYGRDDKQATGPFKSADKIARALAMERERRPAVSPAAVQDIIGLTVVAYYPDEIGAILQCLKSKIKNAKIVQDAPVTWNGYHAHHLVIRSKLAKTAGLQCEVQIKTMLHDAWAAKTHDLNYKPRGQLDERLSRMMQVFGDALESIEIQSEVLRELIHERWNTDIGPRRIVRKRLFEYIPNWRKRKKFVAQADEVLKDMTSQCAKLVAAAPDESLLSDIVEKINDLGEVAPREATWLSIHFAMIRGTEEYISFANGRATDFAIKASDLLSRGIADQDEVGTLPLAIAAYGDSAKAIEVSRYLLRNCKTLDVHQREVVRFNLANLLVEQALNGHALEDGDRRALKGETKELIAGCRRLRKRDPSAFTDLEGLIIVASSDNPPEIRKAIDLLQEGRDKAPPQDKAYADACYELNARLAWRRLLELEARLDRRSRVP